MKVLILVFFALIATSFCDDGEFKFDKDVMILTESTFDKAVKKYEYLLIFFMLHGASIAKDSILNMKKLLQF